MCTYGNRDREPFPFEPWMYKLADIFAEIFSFDSSPNSMTLNMFSGGDQSLWWHSANEHMSKGIHGSADIMSLSSSQSRGFEVKRMFAEKIFSITGNKRVIVA